MGVAVLMGPVGYGTADDGTPRETKLIGSEAGVDALFGVSVAVSGDRIIVGAKDDGVAGVRTGAGYVYRRDGLTWTQEAILRSPEPEPEDQFGTVVAMDGATCVAASVEDSGKLGGAFVFTRGSEGWQFVTRLAAPTPSQLDSFGYSVDIDGDAIIVGAPGEGGIAAAHVYRRGASGWQHEATLQAVDSGTTDNFALSVAIEGNTAVVGAPLHDGASPDTGAVYIFRKGASAWSLAQKLVPVAGGATGQFGEQVAISWGTIAVCIPGARLNDREVGGVAIHQPAGASWNLAETVFPPGGASGDIFYRTLALDGNSLLVGAYTPDLLGAVCVFERDTSGWQNTGTLRASDAQSAGLFGRMVALDTGTAVAGALYSSHDSIQSGVAYAFDEVVPAENAPGYVLVDRARLVRVRRRSLAASQRISVSGILDTGPTAVDFAAPAVLSIAGRTVDVPGLARAPRGSALVYDDGEVALRVRPNRAGTSRTPFTLTVRGSAADGVGPNDPLAVGYSTPELSASSSFQLQGSRFRRGGRGAAWSSPELAIVHLGASLGGQGRDRLTLELAVPSSTMSVAAATPVEFAIGDSFDSVVPATAFRMRGAKQMFRGNVGGVNAVTYDPATGRLRLEAANVELGEFPDGAVPLGISVTTNEGTRECMVRVARRGRSIRY